MIFDKNEIEDLVFTVFTYGSKQAIETANKLKEMLDRGSDVFFIDDMNGEEFEKDMERSQRQYEREKRKPILEYDTQKEFGDEIRHPDVIIPF